MQTIDAFERALEQGFDLLWTIVLKPAFGDVEHRFHCRVEQFVAGAAFRLERRLCDTGTGIDELSQDGPFAHDVGVGNYVGRGRRFRGEFGKIADAAHAFGESARLQRLRECHHVEWLQVIGQRRHDLEDDLVFRPIEVARLDLVSNDIPGVVAHHEAAEDGLLGLDRVRGDL